MKVCNGLRQECPAPQPHDEIVIDGVEADCPLGRALADLDEANDRIGELEKEINVLDEQLRRLERGA